MHSTLHAALVIGWSASVACGQAQAPSAATETPATHGERSIASIDIERVRELVRITDTLGDDLWPGFDTRLTALAVNHDDRQEILIGHPFPPVEFRAFGGRTVGERPVMIRDGVTRYGPRGGGWGIPLGGMSAAYVSTVQPDQTTEEHLSVLLHECFHIFQVWYRQSDTNAYATPPEDDPVYSSQLGLECRILDAAVRASSVEDVQELARMFIAVREQRRATLSPRLGLHENEQEYFEGTPTYVQARMFQLMDERGGLEATGNSRDPHYTHFRDAGASYLAELEKIIPPQDQIVTFEYTRYYSGMAQCLVLDRLRPGWKHEMRENGMTPYALLRRQYPDLAGGDEVLTKVAADRFGYADILAQHESLIAARIALMRTILEASGRVYRIHHREIPARFNWRPVGPALEVPDSVESAPGGVLIWMGGIRQFDKGQLRLTTEDVPVVYRRDYIQWIDVEPESDGDDFALSYDAITDDVYQGVQIVTDGFTLTLPRARITMSDASVDVHPLPAEQ